MSTRSTVVRKLLAEVHEALTTSHAHLVVIGDEVTTPHLPKLLADSLRGEIDSVTVPLAGSRETVVDCLLEAIRDARRSREDDDAPAPGGRQRLALMLPEALSVPTSSLRSLHEIASHLGGHRIVLFVDRESTSFPDPGEELETRLGVTLSKIEMETPTLRLQPASAPPSSPAPSAPEPEPEPAPEPAAPEPELPRFAEPAVVAAPRRLDIRARQRARRRARIWRWTVSTAVFAGCLAASGVVRHGPVVPTPVRGEAPAEVAQTAAAEAPPAPAPQPARSEVEEPVAVAKVETVVPAPQPSPQPGAEPAAPARPEPPEPAPASPAAPAPAAAPARRPRPAARAAAPPRPTVLVNFNAEPWAELDVDGRSLGVTPIGNVRLSEGQHRVRATFPDGRVVERRIRVDERRRRFPIR